MTKERIAQLLALCNAATEGPWDIPEGNLNGCAYAVGPIAGYDFDALSLRPNDPDLLFTAEARTAVPELLDEVERLRTENAMLRAKLTEEPAILREIASCISASDKGPDCYWRLYERADEIEKMLQTNKDK